MATSFAAPVYTYQFKITNSTLKEQTYVIKPPNMPSPVPLSANRAFPTLYTCGLAPSASATFTTEIPSNSQEAHLFLIKATSMVMSKEGFLPQSSDILIDFWRDEGGLKGDCCEIKHTTGWELNWVWRAWSEGPRFGHAPQTGLASVSR